MTSNGKAGKIDGLFIAPTEPPRLRDIGEVSLVTERNGVDVLWAAQGGLWGIQRKELSDLVASKSDGRLAKELAQMSGLEVAVIVVEGRPTWTNEGVLMSEWAELSRRQLHGMLWSCRLRGVWIEYTEDLDHTIDVVRWLRDWSRKGRHSGMRGRPKPDGNWGKVSDREWAIHLLSGMEAIGPTMAERIWEAFGRVPLAWTVTEEEMLEVPGIGPKRARSLMKALEGKDE